MNKKRTRLVRAWALVLAAVLMIVSCVHVFAGETPEIGENACEAALAASQKSKALSAYKKFLSQSKIKWGTTYYPARELKFALVDINGDKIPELYVNNESAAAAQGVYALYAYIDGKVKEIYRFGNCRSMGEYYPAKGIFVESGGRMGIGDASYVKYRSGKTSVQISYTVNLTTNVKTYYSGQYYDTWKKISKSSFDAKKKSLLGKASKKSKWTMRKNTSANRTKYLK